MLKVALVFLGSGVGGVLRYGLSGWVQKSANGTFPFGTLVVNVLGCLAIGFLGAGFASRLMIREEYRVALIVGVLGGFTTFSAFGAETFTLLLNGQFVSALINILASVGLGLMAVWAGYHLAEHWLGA